MTKIFTTTTASTNANLPTLVDASTEMAAYTTALLAATGATVITDVISTAQLNAVARFVLDTKAAYIDGVLTNLYAKIPFFMPLAGVSLTAALVPVKRPSGTITNTSFVSGDYSAATGLAGDGSTKSVDLGFQISSLGSDNLGLLYQARLASNSNARQDFLASATNLFGVATRTGANGLAFYAYTASGGGLLQTTTPSSAGVIGANRSAGGLIAYRNGVQINATAGSVGGSRPAANLLAFRSLNTYGSLVLTDSCTASEFIYISNAVSALIAGLGR
jgi:hypothetical protein